MNIRKNPYRIKNILKRTLTNISYFFYFWILPAIGGLIFGLYISSLTEVKKIYIIGCKYFSAEQLKQYALSFLEQHSKIQNKISLLEQTLQDIDYIKSVKVNLNLKGELFIHIQEHAPLAYTSNDLILTKNMTQIQSNPIFRPLLQKIQLNPNIPLTYEELSDFLNIMDKSHFKPDLCVFVRSGRWNLRLKEKLIKLPEYELKEGLKTLEHFINIKPGDYELSKEVDLRKKGHIITKLNSFLR